MKENFKKEMECFKFDGNRYIVVLWEEVPEDKIELALQTLIPYLREQVVTFDSRETIEYKDIPKTKDLSGSVEVLQVCWHNPEHGAYAEPEGWYIIESFINYKGDMW